MFFTSWTSKRLGDLEKLIMDANEISNIAIGCAIEVHRKLGAGLLESACETCLVYELELAGLEVKTQVPLPLVYKDIKMDIGYRLDILVNNLVVIEVKSVECLKEVNTAQVLTYMKLTGCEIGLLINFNVPVLKDGIKRLIRTRKDSDHNLDLKSS